MLNYLQRHTLNCFLWSTYLVKLNRSNITTQKMHDYNSGMRNSRKCSFIDFETNNNAYLFTYNVIYLAVLF